MNKITTIGLILFLLMHLETVAQFSLTAELRPRGEYRHGFKTLFSDDDDPAFFVSQRTRLNADYKSERLALGISLQDVRVWGDVAQLSVSDKPLMVHQAWGEYRFNPVVSVKVGRQEISYDDQRIFGSVDWTQQGRSHDAALLRFLFANVKTDVGFAYNQEGEKLSGTILTLKNTYKTFQYFWSHYQINNFGLSVLVLNNGQQHEKSVDTTFKTVYSQTFGSRITYVSGGLNLNGAAYLQTGKNGADKELSAWYAAAEIGYKPFNGFVGTLGFEILSGKGQNDASATDKSFTPLYGTNHKFNGFMDYFYVGNHIGNVGLEDFYLNLAYTSGRSGFSVVPHLFRANGAVTDPVTGKEMDKGLGVELDVVYSFKMSDDAMLQAGYSQMFAQSALAVLKGGDDKVTQNWAWIMLTFKPVLFKN